MTTELKLCKDCKHHTNQNETYSWKTDRFTQQDTCLTTVSELDNIKGNHEYVSCSTMRISCMPCKPEALLFESKLSLWTKLKNIIHKPL